MSVHYALIALGLVAMSAGVAMGCSSSGDSAAPAPLVVTPVMWNPSSVDLGKVQAVAEQDQSVIVFGSKGVQTLTSGSLVSSDETITSWRSAAVVPSAEALSTWLVGIDDGGHVQRVVPGAAPKDVSEGYGLATDKVENVVAGTGGAAFLLDTGVAMIAGSNVTRYKATARSIAASGSAVAIADGTALRILDQGRESDFALADAQLVAYDGFGNLAAATSHALYLVRGAALTKVYDAGGRTIHQLAGAGPNVWLTVDDDLGLWRDAHIALASGGALAPDATLSGSASGDVWVISAGQLQRWSAQAPASAAAAGDEATWNATVQPIYAAVCSNCHSPPGSGKDSANIDLSTYAAWSARRTRVYARIVTQAGTPSQMPPPTSSFAITAEQRAAIEAWSKP